MKKLSRGVLFTVEGIDGSGKSTVSRAMAEYFNTKVLTILTREPGGTEFGKELRKIVQNYKQDIDQKSEFFLYAADRAQHITYVVKPALEQNKLVISDRMADSTRAYQGFGRGVQQDMLESVTSWIMDGIKPDLTFYLVLDSNTAYKRIAERKQELTRFEKENKAFFERVITGFEVIYKNRQDVIRIDAQQTPEVIIEYVIKAAEEFLKDYYV